MSTSRFALRLLTSSDALGVREEVVGDLLEEIARGRSRLWVWQQLIGLYGGVVVGRARRCARVTVPAVAFAVCVVLLAAVRIASFSSVFEAWLGIYCLSGTLSLFAHMAARTADWRVGVTPETPGATEPRSVA